ncbi:MAG: nuclear transport factor 2 family protein [Candidatus Aminicenantes bacterium]|nr:nuclear transport factor 2 family protein [Candidatus Aminicenantes bacterium]
MKKKSFIILGLVVIPLIFSNLFCADDQAAVEKVIKSSYFNGAFNDLDTKAMEKGFHPDFAIFSAKGTQLAKYPIAVWIQAIEKKKNDPGFEPEKSAMECKIMSLDVTGGCASAKVEIGKNGDLIYTDYLSLLKFENGWKIVAKVYHSHKH